MLRYRWEIEAEAKAGKVDRAADDLTEVAEDPSIGEDHFLALPEIISRMLAQNVFRGYTVKGREQ